MKKQMLKSALIALAGVGLMSGTGWALQISLTYNDDALTTLTYNDEVGGQDLTVDANGLLTIFNNNYNGWNVGLAAALSNPTYGTSSLPTLSLTDLGLSKASGASSKLTIAATEEFSGNSSWDFESFYTLLNGASWTGFSGTNYTVVISQNGIDYDYDFGALPSSATDDIYEIFSSSSIDFSQNWSLSLVTSFTGSTGTAQFDAIAAPVPEPASMLLFGAGILGLAGVVRRKNAA